jgi:hypothetical protein
VNRETDALLLERLRSLGLAGVNRLTTHANRTVMLTLQRGHLRIHRGYGMAPDRVLKAIVRFLKPRLPRAMRKAVEHEFLSFPVHLYAPPAPRKEPERPRPGDLRLLHQLVLTHERFNRQCFGGAKMDIQVGSSGRMRTRLGELSVNKSTGEAIEIAISRSHLRRHGWAEVEQTVLHEMVHQWQVENRLPLDHGPMFRKKAREVGIEPRARRSVAREVREIDAV